jgi:K+-sensing histidine kinase KdpD
MKFLSYGVMVYMLLALIWWTLLLNRNNDLLHQKNLEILDLNYTATEQTSTSISKYQYLKKLQWDDYKKKQYMIFGEGLVFGISLILGMWFIQKAYNQEIENSKKQKNFLLSITHELKSPIASINLMTETLLKHQLNQEKVSDLHQSILCESKRLDALISNLLFAARLDNAYSYNFEKCDLEVLVKSVIKNTLLTHAEAEVGYYGDFDQIELEADREAIISLLNNLVENAVKYSPIPANVNIKVTKKQKNVEIQVSDLGYGIPENEKDKVTQQFYRIGNEDTRKTKGTGLGLYIVSKIVKAHHGHIKITDNKPNGTKIIISIPEKQLK